jgi:hypothetical protein
MHFSGEVHCAPARQLQQAHLRLLRQSCGPLICRYEVRFISIPKQVNLINVILLLYSADICNSYFAFDANTYTGYSKKNFKMLFEILLCGECYEMLVPNGLQTIHCSIS